MDASLWRFDALDRLFFRDGRPMNQGEMAWVESQFPPSGRTLQGAVRAAVILAQGGDFESFRKGVSPLNAALGSTADLGPLRLTGPFLSRSDVTLFPAPLDLVHTEAGFSLLSVVENMPLECDLGKRCLPRTEQRGAKTQEGRYLTRDAMASYLAGDTSPVRTPCHTSDGSATLWPLYPEAGDQPALADSEPKMGLARDNDRRTAEEAMLYSIGFVRPRPGVGLSLLVAGLPPTLLPPSPALQRLGGEARLAGVTVGPVPPDILPAAAPLEAWKGEVRFRLVFTSPAIFRADGTSWLPPGFAPEEPAGGGAAVWAGILEDSEGDVRFECRIVSACVGKPIKIGGWDMAGNGPRDLVCHLPAGSVLFCRTSEANLDQVRRLHGRKLGNATEFGFGHVLLGNWRHP